MKPSKKIGLGMPLLLCVLALALCPRPSRADNLYQPAAADFRPLYDRDSVNKNYQAWAGGNSYWYWVRTFYKGYTKRILGVTIVRQAGWTATSRLVVSHIALEPARQELTLALNTLGRDMAGEWAKDDRVGRIHDRDLRRWGDVIAEAGSRDSGSGQVLLAAVRAIQAEVNRRLSSRP